jgi:hypothetical protein
MNDLYIEGTLSSPLIAASRQTGVLAMRGDSYPENAYELFSQVISWAQRYLKETQQPLRLELRLLYLNTSSIKGMMDICDLLEDAHRTGREVSITWYYDRRNERVAELADEFREDCTFPFEILADA